MFTSIVYLVISVDFSGCALLIQSSFAFLDTVFTNIFLCVEFHVQVFEFTQFWLILLYSVFFHVDLLYVSPHSYCCQGDTMMS